jgi:hypothetical protein
VAAEAGTEVVGARAAYELKRFEPRRSEIYIYDLAGEQEDARMRQRRHGARLALEAGAAGGVAGDIRGEPLIAASRRSRGSRARYTSPMPPAPSGAMIS